jgi:hypothetical protein
MSLYYAMLIIGFIAGGAYYVGKLEPGESANPYHVAESCVCGFTLAAGMHLMLCSLMVTQLVHHCDHHGGHVQLEGGIYCGMDVVHRFHIAAAGVFTVAVTQKALKTLTEH